MLEGIVSKRIGSRYVSGRTRAWLKTENPALWAYLTRMLSNADLDCLIADLRTNPLAQQELRQVREGAYVSLKQSIDGYDVRQQAVRSSFTMVSNAKLD